MLILLGVRNKGRDEAAWSFIRNYIVSMFVLLAAAQSWASFPFVLISVGVDRKFLALPDVQLSHCFRCFGVFSPEPLHPPSYEVQ